MKFLIDNALSPLVASGLQQAGHDAVHVRDCQMHDAADELIFAKAARESRVIVSADTAFGTLLALRKVGEPSVILFRRGLDRVPSNQVALLLSNLSAIQSYLENGCVVVFDENRIRIRELPITE